MEAGGKRYFPQGLRPSHLPAAPPSFHPALLLPQGSFYHLLLCSFSFCLERVGGLAGKEREERMNLIILVRPFSGEAHAGCA